MQVVAGRINCELCNKVRKQIGCVIPPESRTADGKRTAAWAKLVYLLKSYLESSSHIAEHEKLIADSSKNADIHSRIGMSLLKAVYHNIKTGASFRFLDIVSEREGDRMLISYQLYKCRELIDNLVIEIQRFMLLYHNGEIDNFVFQVLQRRHSIIELN